MSENAPVRVFISGACAGLAEVRQALGTHPEIEIVGTAVEPARAAQKLAASNAQVVMHGSSRTDRMPVEDVEAIRQATSAPIVLVTTSSATGLLHEALAHGVADIVLGAALATTLFAMFTNLLVSRRLAQALGRKRVTGMTGHVVLIGLGSVGMRVLEALRAIRDVVVVEADDDGRFVSQARALGVPVVIGDATLSQTLDLVNLHEASAVAVLTSDDLTNVEIALALRDRMAFANRHRPMVVRVFDRQLASSVEHSFGFRHVRSTAALAAPWFVGAALGLDVLDTFYVDRQPFLLARMTVAAGGGLDGSSMRQLAARTRVIALDHGDGSLEYPPRRDTIFAAGAAAYLVGPYEELLQVLLSDISVHPDETFPVPRAT